MLMRLVSRYWLIVPLLLLAIVVRDWVESDNDTVEIEDTIDMSATKSDYYLEQFKSRKYDANGKLEYIVTGNTLAHYPTDDRSEITAPSLVMHGDTIEWNIDSKTGELKKNPSVFTLYGDVVVKRTSDGSTPVTMRTEEISIHTDSNEVVTDKAVEILSETWQLRSVGLQSSLDEGKLNLLSSVKGHYEIANSE